MAKRQFNNVAQMVATQRSMQLWSSLDTMLLECNALRTSPSHALQLIKNKALVNQVVVDQAGLLNAAKVLAKDVNEYSEKLKAIHEEHQAVAQKHKGDPTVQPDTLAQLMSLGESYSNWITSYQLVVLPSAFAVTGFFQPQNQPSQQVHMNGLPDAPTASI